MTASKRRTARLRRENPSGLNRLVHARRRGAMRRAAIAAFAAGVALLSTTGCDTEYWAWRRQYLQENGYDDANRQNVGSRSGGSQGATWDWCMTCGGSGSVHYVTTEDELDRFTALVGDLAAG